MKRQLPIILIVLSLVACASSKEQSNSGVSSNSENLQIHTDGFSFFPVPENVQIQKEIVTSYLNQELYDYSNMDAQINAKTDLGDNLPISLRYQSLWYPYETKSYKVSVKDLSDGQTVFYEETEAESVDFINYKTSPVNNYRLTVTTVIDGKDVETHDYDFAVPASYFRTITIDGVNNFRDLGDGKLMKQGLIYRSATFENNTSINSDKPVTISEKGKEQISYLHLTSEIDLRKDEEKTLTDKSYIGLKYFKAPMYYGGQNLLTYKSAEYDNPETIRSVFEFLAEENNYPVDFHCVRGTDRTGCIAYLIKGLMGFEELELYHDYLFSNFYNIGSPVKLENIYYASNPNATTRYVNVIMQTEGSTISEKIYNYLASDKVGVKKESLDKIIALLKA